VDLPKLQVNRQPNNLLNIWKTNITNVGSIHIEFVGIDRRRLLLHKDLVQLNLNEKRGRKKRWSWTDWRYQWGLYKNYTWTSDVPYKTNWFMLWQSMFVMISKSNISRKSKWCPYQPLLLVIFLWRLKFTHRKMSRLNR